MECLCPLLLFLVFSFHLFPFSSIIAITIAAFSICFLGYTGLRVTKLLTMGVLGIWTDEEFQQKKTELLSKI